MFLYIVTSIICITVVYICFMFLFIVWGFLMFVHGNNITNYHRGSQDQPAPDHHDDQAHRLEALPAGRDLQNGHSYEEFKLRFKVI